MAAATTTTDPEPDRGCVCESYAATFDPTWGPGTKLRPQWCRDEPVHLAHWLSHRGARFFVVMEIFTLNTGYEVCEVIKEIPIDEFKQWCVGTSMYETDDGHEVDVQTHLEDGHVISSFTRRDVNWRGGGIFETWSTRDGLKHGVNIEYHDGKTAFISREAVYDHGECVLERVYPWDVYLTDPAMQEDEDDKEEEDEDDKEEDMANQSRV